MSPASGRCSALVLIQKAGTTLKKILGATGRVLEKLIVFNFRLSRTTTIGLSSREPFTCWEVWEPAV